MITLIMFGEEYKLQSSSVLLLYIFQLVHLERGAWHCSPLIRKFNMDWSKRCPPYHFLSSYPSGKYICKYQLQDLQNMVP